MDFEIIAAEESPLGMIILRERAPLSDGAEPIVEITLDHQFLMSSLSTASERALSRLAIEWHGGKGLHVLVGGLGLGYTAHQALASHRVARVDVVELLNPVITWMRSGMVPISGALGAELAPGGRMTIRQGDVYGELQADPVTSYDLILIDVDHAPDDALGEPNDAFHSSQGVALAREHLAEGGVLGVWSCTANDAFTAVLRSVFREVEARPVEFLNRLLGEPETNWVFLARG